MGASSGSATYLRFLVEGEPPKDYATKFEQAVEARRFLPLSAAGTDGMGWVPIDDPFDDELPITRDRFHFGHLIVLAYREDKLSIPRARLNHLVKQRQRKVEEEGKKVTRALTKAIKEAVLSELRQKTMPRSRVMDLMWDLDRREVRIFGRGPMARENATACFERTFGVRAVEATYATRAFAMDLSKRARSVLENIEPDEFFDFGGA
jgi:DNA recombination-dependent growth factor C